jgi:ABC-2 type transport system ATP-binding protein
MVDRLFKPDTAAMDAPVRVESLVIDYGSIRALDHFDLAIPKGEVFGLLGPNGAGKSTLFQVLATLLPPLIGNVEIAGIPVSEDTETIRSRIAFMPDLAPLPSDLRAIEYLRVYAECYGLRGKARDQRVAEVLNRVQLADRAKDFSTNLSLGMRQRLAFAKAILHRPELLILDEPASGLDPAARVQLRQTLQLLAAEGTTVILSSHVLSDIEDLCTSIGLIHQGRLIDAGKTSEVLRRQGKGLARVKVHAPGQLSALALWTTRQPELSIAMQHPEDDSLVIGFDEKELPTAELFRRIADADLGVTAFQPLVVRLEEVIINLQRSAEDS